MSTPESSASNSGPGTGREDVVRIKCPKLECQRILAVPMNARGKLVRCRNCGANIRIPAAVVKPPAAKPGDREKDAA